MRYTLMLWVLLVSCTPVFRREPLRARPQPGEFELGRHTFFDVGPPFDFYEVFRVHSSGAGTSVERILLTPGTGKCQSAATVEIATASLDVSPGSLVEPFSLCSIPEKDLRREAKRCENCLVFSGAHVAFRVACGEKSRLIRAEVLGKDLFDPRPDTPQYTSSVMRLLEKLEEAVGPGPLDKPIFSISKTDSSDSPHGNPHSDSPTLRRLVAGEFDGLFPDAPDKLADLYLDSQRTIPTPTARLSGSAPISPETFVAPQYPILARLARVEGTVSVRLEVDESGSVANAEFINAHPLLQPAVQDVLNKWRFPRSDSSRQVSSTIEFALNCYP